MVCSFTKLGLVYYEVLISITPPDLDGFWRVLTLLGPVAEGLRDWALASAAGKIKYGEDIKQSYLPLRHLYSHTAFFFFFFEVVCVSGTKVK